MAPNPRVAKAFRAMKGLGIPEEKTKPVLKNLLRVYEKNWELIEEENYRALIDAIFDSEDTQAAEVKNNVDNAEVEKKKKLEQDEQRMNAIEEETHIQEELENPLKRHQEDQASPSSITPSNTSTGTLFKKPKLEVEEQPPKSQPELQSPVKTTVTEPVSPLKQVKNKGKQPLIPDAFIVLKDEPLTDNLPRLKAHNPVIIPEPSTNGDTSTENNSAKELTISNHAQATSIGSTAKLDIASSSSGEIKLSLSCKSDKEKAKFLVTNVDTVLKRMDEKCLKSYKVLDPKFSVKKLMEDMCECFLDIQSDSSGEPPVGTDATLPTSPLETCAARGEHMPPNVNGSTANGIERNDHLTPDDVNDMAKGQESVVISFVNEVNNKCLPSFHYIPRNAIFQNAYVNYSLASIADDNCCPTCLGNCLTAPTPCPCALQSGGEFAYTNNGLIKEDILDECIKAIRDPQKCHLSCCKECPLEKSKNNGGLQQPPCKGHLDRGFIKECWLKCGCSKKCGNRVVQGGIKHKLQVFMTRGGKGWGLRTLEDLPKGAFVCEFVGEVLTCGEFYSRVSQSSKKDEYAHPPLLDADWGGENELKEEEALCLDATYYGNVARFINHRCFDANLVEIPVEVENPDRHYYHLAFFTTRKVKALEELTRDYGIDFDDDDNPIKAFTCQCGSRYCRNIGPSR
ncbi:probable inactive histone-lysine N-methyltransferase SUVR2 [Tanacetum coccineum]